MVIPGERQCLPFSALHIVLNSADTTGFYGFCLFLFACFYHPLFNHRTKTFQGQIFVSEEIQYVNFTF